jgi:hypothetical protein
MKRAAATLMFIALYALHQDLWFWHEARPLVFGIFPIGLFYHIVYTILLSLAFWGLVIFLWPSHLETSSAERE